MEVTRMTTTPKKQLVKKDAKGHTETWEWEETPELRKFIEQYGKK